MATVLITGASRGMGLSVAHTLAARGAVVYAGVRSPERLRDRLRDRHRDRHGADGPSADPPDIRPVPLDVTSDASVDAAVREIGAEVDAIDVLVNNAGVPGPFTAAEDVGPADFDAVIATNLLGVVRVTRAFLPLLRRADRPRLVMVSSTMGSLSHQTADPVYTDIAHLPYPASKAALNMLAVQYAKALPDVVVTAVDPGLTATEFTGGAGHSVEVGSQAIVTAAEDTVGPSGRFMDRDGQVSW